MLTSKKCVLVRRKDSSDELSVNDYLNDETNYITINNFKRTSYIDRTNAINRKVIFITGWIADDVDLNEEDQIKFDDDKIFTVDSIEEKQCSFVKSGLIRVVKCSG